MARMGHRTANKQGPGRRRCSDLGLHVRAGDENRTRTISLGSAAATAARGADLASLAVLSDRSCPLITLANGPLMAR